MIKWHLETRKIKDLKPHPKNPRQLSKEQEKQLSISLEKFGLADKPIINLDNTIIGGHQRLRVFKKGNSEVECWVPDRPLDESEVDEFNIRLNKNTGEWDWDILANSWNPDELVAWGFEAKDFFSEDTYAKPEAKEKEPKKCPNCGLEI